MQRQSMRLVGLSVMATLALGCASKGYVNEQVQQQLRAAQQRGDSATAGAVATETQARTQGDAALHDQITTLQQRVDSMGHEIQAQAGRVDSVARFDNPAYFDFNDTTIRADDEELLARFAAIVQQYYPHAMITIEGFADPAGSVAYNRELSLRRAEGVKAYLVGKGFPENQLRTVGLGKTRQVVNGAERDAPGALENRRVVFVIETRGDTPLPTSAGEHGTPHDQ